jgi:hypothetical protein
MTKPKRLWWAWFGDLTYSKQIKKLCHPPAAVVVRTWQSPKGEELP